MDLKDRDAIALWSGRVPPSLTRPTCSGKRCTRPAAAKPDGTWYKQCQPCLDRRRANNRRSFAKSRAEGRDCSRCSSHPRIPGDFLCRRCRDERTAAKEDRRAAKALDQELANVDALLDEGGRKRTPSKLDQGISPWNDPDRKPRRPAAGTYWSPEPDPEPKDDEDWRWSPLNRKTRPRY